MVSGLFVGRARKQTDKHTQEHQLHDYATRALKFGVFVGVCCSRATHRPGTLTFTLLTLT